MTVQIDYRSRINRVSDFIDANLHRELSLEELAAVSHFSKYHFSRVFSEVVGETPFEFIQRLRVERAATMLRVFPDRRISCIAFKCGFNDVSVFSRRFRASFHTSPTHFRRSRVQVRNCSQKGSEPCA